MNADRSTTSDPVSPPAGDPVPLAPERRAGSHVELPEPSPLPRLDVDPLTGRILPISDKERAARWEGMKRRLAEIDAADDTPMEVYEQVMRNIDEERRLQGRPPALEGCY